MLDNIGRIKDHQNRMIEANDWAEYCKAFADYDGESIEFVLLNGISGNTIPKDVKIYNLKYDKLHLSCNIWNGEFGITKLAYLCE